MIQHLIATLYAAGLDPTAEEVADMIWLASQMGMPTFDYAEKRRISLSNKAKLAERNDSSNGGPLTLGLGKDIAAEAQLRDVLSKKNGLGIGVEGLPFGSPSAVALPQTLELGRALRPLKRKVPSRSQLVLDVDATVQRIADTNALLPVLRPVAERWLDLVLVVDTSSSMLIWQQTVVELRSLFENIGAFHTIKTLYLAIDSLQPRLYIRNDVINLPQYEHHPHELIDPNGRQLILILSDFIAPCWNTREVAQMLNTWGQTGMVALVQLLPQQLWPRTALAGARSVYLRSRQPGTSNIELEIEMVSRRFGKQQRLGSPLPIVTLELYLLMSWSQLMVGDSQTWMPGLAFPLEGTITGHQQQRTEQVSAHRLVQQFQAVASPKAQLLASYLTAVPLSLQTIRLVQRVMFDDPQQVELAEVLFSGLIRQVTPAGEIGHLTDIRYEFLDGVPDILLDTVLISDMDTVLSRISNFIEEGTGKRIEFSALLSDPALVSKTQNMSNNQTFAFVPLHILRRMGGKYARLAEQLQERSVSVEASQIELQPLTRKHMAKNDTRASFPVISNILAHLYETKDDARRVASQAGLNVQRINFNGSVINNWHAILLEADKSDHVPIVLEIAQNDYPENLKLQEICEEYYRKRQAQSGINGKISLTGKGLASAEINKSEIRLESPYGTIAPTSHFYIERQADRDCKLYFQQQSSVTVFVKGPRQVGKSSLIHRICYLLKIEQDIAIAYVSLEHFENRLFGNLESFLFEFCRQIGNVLDVPDDIERYWSNRPGAVLAKCSNYMTQHILVVVNRPLVLAIDETEKLLDSPFRDDFFGMLRVWHNARAYEPDFQKLSLFLSSSTEPQLLIDNPNQSPFNVAEQVDLHDFTLDDMQELNRRHENLLTEEQLEMLMNLLNGHPFLVRLALYSLALQKYDFETLLQSATAEEGPFYAHLSQFWQRISESSELTRAIRQICSDKNYPENSVYYRLRGAGLVRRVNGNVIMRNTLYERFFAERLGIAG